MASQPNCTRLSVRRDFDSYVEILGQETNYSLSLLGDCKPQICTAIWGQGNPDISGIGMIVGYALEQFLGIVLAVVAMMTIGQASSILAQLVQRALGSFHDCASFFAFSIEIAAVVFLVREDFGISTDGMGDNNVRISQAVAILVLLPLLYAVIIPFLAPPKRRSETLSGQQGQGAKENSGNQRYFILLVVCWVLAFYPFYSKMNAAFGPSRISNSPNTAITPEQFSNVTELCTTGVTPLNNAEGALMTAFVMLSYLPLSLFIVLRILWLGTDKHHRGSRIHTAIVSITNRLSLKTKQRICAGSIALVPLLACGLLWSVIRVELFQHEMMTAAGSQDPDYSWTFGQVVAVTVFSPIGLEIWLAYSEDECSASGVH